MNEQPVLSPTQLHKSSKAGEAEAGEMTNCSHPPSCPRLGTGGPILKQTHTTAASPPSPPYAPSPPASAQNALPKRLPFCSKANLPPLLLGEVSDSPSSTLFPAEFRAHSLFTQAGTPQGALRALSVYGSWHLVGAPEICVGQASKPACFSPSQLTANCFMGIPRPFHPVPPSAISLADV